jgi:hypothetical protein
MVSDVNSSDPPEGEEALEKAAATLNADMCGTSDSCCTNP